MQNTQEYRLTTNQGIVARKWNELILKQLVYIIICRDVSYIVTTQGKRILYGKVKVVHEMIEIGLSEPVIKGDWHSPVRVFLDPPGL